MSTQPAHPQELPTGEAAAALLAAGVGVIVLALSQLASETSAAFKNAMQVLGNLWMPGAAGIGPYSGKETVALLAWLSSWVLLHGILRKREVSLIAWGIATCLLIGTATTLLWPPVTELLVSH